MCREVGDAAVLDLERIYGDDPFGFGEDEEPEPEPEPVDNTKYVAVAPVTIPDPRRKIEQQLEEFRAKRERVREQVREAAELAKGQSISFDTQTGQWQGEPMALAAHALAERAAQVEVRLRLQIEDREIALPLADVEEVGEFTEEPAVDAETGQTLSSMRFASADGHIGELVRTLEAREVEYRKLLAEGFPDHSLTARDAAAQVAEARAQVDAAKMEGARRHRDARRAERVQERALELAGDDPTDYALNQATRQAREEQRQAILSSALPAGSKIYPSDDPVVRFLTAGATIEPAALEGIPDKPTVNALRYLGAVIGEDAERWADDSAPLPSRQQQVIARLEEGRRETAKRNAARAKARIEQAQPRRATR